ncbi:MAG TPA: hypothetical protein PK948_00135 [Gemmatimonadales bacterium]|nr:hypothetical protein [Gemmatimonadales bacterium]
MPARDSAEQAQLLRLTVLLGGPVLFIGALALYFVLRGSHLPGLVVLLLYLLLLPATWGVILLAEAATTRSAVGVITALHAAHTAPRPQGFSRQEALVAQGRLEEAATAYRLHLLAAPDDIAAMVALGRLLGGPLGDTPGAEAAYQSARRLEPDAGWARVIANDLIDLFERTGQDGRMRVELARFADRYRGTREGDAAAERLRAMREVPRQGA